MAGTRPIRYHRPPGWARPAGLGDYDDDGSGMDLWGTPSVDGITVEYSPPPLVDVTPIDPINPFDFLFSPPTPLYSPGDLNTNISTPNIPAPAGADPITTLLKKLFKAPTGKVAPGGGGGSGGGLPAPKLTPPTQLPNKASSLTANPALAAGLGLVALVFGAALLSGHHGRSGGGRRRR